MSKWRRMIYLLPHTKVNLKCVKYWSERFETMNLPEDMRGKFQTSLLDSFFLLFCLCPDEIWRQSMYLLPSKWEMPPQALCFKTWSPDHRTIWEDCKALEGDMCYWSRPWSFIVYSASCPLISILSVSLPLSVFLSFSVSLFFLPPLSLTFIPSSPSPDYEYIVAR